MNTSLIRFLREKVQSFSTARAIAVSLAFVVPLISGIGVLVADGFGLKEASWLWLAGFLAVYALMTGVIHLVRLDERLEKKRGITIAQVIGSSGFALIRSKPKPAPNKSPTSLEGSGASFPLSALMFEHASEIGQGKRRRRRVLAALHSSGFSVIREGLPSKQPARRDRDA